MGKFLDNQSEGKQIASNQISRGMPQLPGMSFSAGGINAPIVQKYGQSEYKDLASAEALTRDIEDLERIVKGDIKKPFLKKSQFLGSGLFTMGPFKGVGTGGQDFALMKKSVGERILRLRSGAQINEKEYKRFMDMLPTIFREDELDLKQLDRFKQEFQSIKGRILQGSLWNPKTDDFDISEEDILETMRANNMTREEVLNNLGVSNG